MPAQGQAAFPFGGKAVRNPVNAPIAGVPLDFEVKVNDNGNIEIEYPEGITDEQKAQLDELRRRFEDGTLEAPAIPADTGHRHEVMLTTQFFPPPDTALDPESITLDPVAIVRCVTSARSPNVIFVGSTPMPGGQPGEMALVRFTQPRHAKSVRMFFRSGGLKDVPSKDRHWNVDAGIPIMLRLEGMLVGEDTIPDLDTDNTDEKLSPPVKCFVLSNVTARG